MSNLIRIIEGIATTIIIDVIKASGKSRKSIRKIIQYLRMLMMHAEWRGRITFVGFCVLLFLEALYFELLGPKFSRALVGTETDRLVLGHRWITYEPQEFTPSRSDGLDMDAIDQELEWIRRAGFDGVITFSCCGDIARIPERAKAKGFAVIAGVWDPNNWLEVATAIANKSYVDAYCVGHNNLGPKYAFSELAAAVGKIRFRTRHPVTTTERIGRYASDRKLLELGDFVFPDLHISIEEKGPWAASTDADSGARQTIALVQSLRDVLGAAGRPVLLKMITYPICGVSGASVEEQSRFFLDILRTRPDADPRVPPDIGISVHTAFDPTWKVDWPVYKWDAYMGLLEKDGSPRPAAREIVKRLP